MRSEPEFNIHSKNNLGDIVESENGEFIAINLLTKLKKDDALRVITFNKRFEKIYEYEFDNIISLKETNNKNLPLEYQNMVLDNQGTAYLLGRIFNTNDKDLEKKDTPNYYFVLFKADETLKNQAVVPVESENIIRSLQLVTKEEKLAAVGLYSETADLGMFELQNGDRYDGVVRFNIDKTSLSKLKESFQPFSEEFIVEKYGKMKDKIKSYLSYRSIFMLNNGNVIINAEESEIYAPDNSKIQTEKIYKDIIACSIDDEGKLLWARNINKNQKAWSVTNIPFFSYTATVKNNVSYYLVNSPSEVLLKNNQIELGEGPRLYVLKIYENGAFRYEKPLYKNILNAQLEVRFGILINQTDLLMQAESDDKPLLIKIYFNKK